MRFRQLGCPRYPGVLFQKCNFCCPRLRNRVPSLLARRARGLRNGRHVHKRCSHSRRLRLRNRSSSGIGRLNAHRRRRFRNRSGSGFEIVATGTSTSLLPAGKNSPPAPPVLVARSRPRQSLPPPPQRLHTPSAFHGRARSQPLRCPKPLTPPSSSMPLCSLPLPLQPWPPSSPAHRSPAPLASRLSSA